MRIKAKLTPNTILRPGDSQATITAALNTSNTRIEFMPGDYFITTQLSVTASGVYVEGNGANIIGGVKIPWSAWTAINSSDVLWSRLPSSLRASIVKVNLRDFGITPSSFDTPANETLLNNEPRYMELYYNGVKQTLPQWPRSDWAFVDTIGSTSFTVTGKTFTYSDTSSAFVHAFMGTTYSDVRVANITAAGNTITWGSPGLGTSSTLTVNGRFRIVNVPEEFDVGNYYLNQSGTAFDLYFLPDTTGYDAYIPICYDYLLYLDTCANTTIKNLNFYYSRRRGTRINKCQNTSVVNCLFDGATTYGAQLSDDTDKTISQNISYINCVFRQCGYGGVVLSTGGGNNTKARAILFDQKFNIINCNISDNNTRIYGVGNVYYFGGVKNSLIKDNVIMNTPGQGIALRGNDNTISGNYIKNSCYQMSDAGAIYVYGRNWDFANNVIKNNYIENVTLNASYFPGSTGAFITGIYLDDQAPGNIVTSNTVSGASRGIMLTTGHGNIASGNVFYSTQDIVWVYQAGIGRFDAFSNNSTYERKWCVPTTVGTHSIVVDGFTVGPLSTAVPLSDYVFTIKYALAMHYLGSYPDPNIYCVYDTTGVNTTEFVLVNGYGMSTFSIVNGGGATAYELPSSVYQDTIKRFRINSSGTYNITLPAGTTATINTSTGTAGLQTALNAVTTGFVVTGTLSSSAIVTNSNGISTFIFNNVTGGCSFTDIPFYGQRIQDWKNFENNYVKYYTGTTSGYSAWSYPYVQNVLTQNGGRFGYDLYFTDNSYDSNSTYSDPVYNGPSQVTAARNTSFSGTFSG